MPKIKANGIEIYYEVHGSGKPLVLIAGLGYSMWMWHRMLPFLAQGCQVIAFDNRGVGKTEKPQGPYSAQLLADDTAELLHGLGISQVAILGHSMGGFIAQAMVLAYPDMVSKLILSATNFGGPHHMPVTPEAFAVLADVTTEPVERFRRGLAVSTAPGFAEKNPEIIHQWMEFRAQNPVDPIPYQAQMAIGLGLLSEESSFEKRLSQVKTRTLILFGEHDKVVPPGNADLLAQQIPNHQVCILPDAGHFFPMEKPAEASQVILDFLRS